MRPSEACQQHKEIIRQIVGRNHATNPRVLGSALHGEDTEDSDLNTATDYLPELNMHIVAEQLRTRTRMP